MWLLKTIYALTERPVSVTTAPVASTMPEEQKIQLFNTTNHVVYCGSGAHTALEQAWGYRPSCIYPSETTTRTMGLRGFSICQGSSQSPSLRENAVFEAENVNFMFVSIGVVNKTWAFLPMQLYVLHPQFNIDNQGCSLFGSFWSVNLPLWTYLAALWTAFLTFPTTM